MDPDVLPVRFHYGGTFDFDGYSLHYIRGKVGMSHIERDKLSLPELRGFLGDHVNLIVEDVAEFHWLTPGADLSNGLRPLSNDQSCRYMSDCIPVDGVAEVYVEIYKVVGGELVIWTYEPENNAVIILGSPNQMIGIEDVGTISSDGESTESDSDLEGSDYLQGDDDTSGDDEEANEFMMNARNQRKNPATIVAISHENGEENNFLDDSDPPMMDSSEEDSYEDEDDGLLHLM
ncbi:unnamed protein product [Urochloa humidicola]